MQHITAASEVQASASSKVEVSANDLITGVNGFATGSVLTHASRYIDPKLHLVVKDSLIRNEDQFAQPLIFSMNSSAKNDQGLGTLNQEFLWFLQHNLQSAVEYYKDHPTDATMFCALRFVFIMKGYVTRDKSVASEIKILSDGDYEKASEKYQLPISVADFKTMILAAYALSEWVVLVSMLSYFKKGHHFASDQRQQINSLWQGSYGNDKYPQFDGNMLYHDACHVLGVKNPTVHIYKSMDQQAVKAMPKAQHPIHVPEPFRLRFQGAPCGTAKVSVAASALRSCSTTMWYGYFYEYMGAHIDTINNAFDAMIEDPLPYHINANLYGRDRANTAALDRALSAIQPYVLAYIDCVHQDSRLKEQKCFNKGADDVRGLIAVFKSIIRNEAEAVKEIRSMKAFFALYAKPDARGKVSSETDVRRQVAKANAIAAQKKAAKPKRVRVIPAAQADTQDADHDEDLQIETDVVRIAAADRVENLSSLLSPDDEGGTDGLQGIGALNTTRQ